MVEPNHIPILKANKHDEQQMTEIFDAKFDRTENELIVKLPTSWKGAEDENFRIVLDEICVIFPERVYDSIGEYTVLTFLESIMNAGLIRPDDIQKALEHIV